MTDARHGPRRVPGEADGDRLERFERDLIARLARIESRLDALEATGSTLGESTSPADRAAMRSDQIAASSDDAAKPAGEGSLAVSPPAPPPPPPPPAHAPVGRSVAAAGSADGRDIDRSPVPAATASAPPTSPPAIGGRGDLSRRRESAPDSATHRLERLVGGSVTAWIGALIIAGGAAIFVTYAFREGWIGRLGPTARFSIATAVALTLLLVGELVRTRRGAFAAAGFSIAGIAGLFVSAWSASGSGGVLGPTGLLVCGAIAAGLGVLVTIRSMRASVGVVAMVGGYVVPLLTREPVTPLIGGIYLSLLLAAALGTSLRGERLRPLRVTALILHTPLAIFWIAACLRTGHSLQALAFATIWWAAFCGEAWMAAVRGQSARLNAVTLLSASFAFAAISAVPLARVGRGSGDPMSWVPVLLGAALVGWATLFSPIRLWEGNEQRKQEGVDPTSSPDGSADAADREGASVAAASRALELFAIAAWGAGGSLVALGLGAIVSSTVALTLAWAVIAVGAVELARRTARVGVAVYGLAVGVLAAISATSLVVTLMSATRTPSGQPMGIPGGGGWLLLLRLESLVVLAASLASLACALRWPVAAPGGSWSRSLLFGESRGADAVGSHDAVAATIFGFAVLWGLGSLTVGGSWSAVALMLIAFTLLAALGPQVRRQGGAATAVASLAFPVLAWVVVAGSRQSLAAPAGAWAWAGLGWGDRTLVALAIATVAWIAAWRVPRTLWGRLLLVTVGAVIVGLAGTFDLRWSVRGGDWSTRLLAGQAISLIWVAVGAAIASRTRLVGGASAVFPGGLAALGGALWWIWLTAADSRSIAPGWVWAWSVPISAAAVVAGLLLTMWLVRTGMPNGEASRDEGDLSRREPVSIADGREELSLRIVLSAAAILVILAAGHREIVGFVDAAWEWSPPSGTEGAAYRSVRGAATSVWWGLFGAGLVAAGFRASVAAGGVGRSMRYGGLALLGITAAKFATVDLWTAGTLARIAAMFAVGMLLIGVSVLYARLSRSIGVSTDAVSDPGSGPV